MKRNLLTFAAGCAVACLAVGAQAGEDYVVLFGHTGEVMPATELASYGKAIPVSKTIKSPGDITWNVTYLDGGSAGFNDATLGAARKATLDAVLAYLNTVIGESGTCLVEVTASQFDGTGALASAGTLYSTSAGFHPGVAFEHITTGVDPAPGFPDIVVTVDFGYPWHLGTGANGGVPSDYDLFSVLLHEITHGLGIASAVASSAGDSAIGVGSYTTWDELLHRSSDGTRVWNASQTYQGVSLTGGDNTVDFRGTAATATFGAFPPIYTPVGFQSGSSVAHWQLNAPIDSDTVMRPQIALDTENRVFEPFELSAFQDLGYDLEVSSVGAWMQY